MSATPTNPQVIAAIARVKERRAHQYASDQYGIDTTIEDAVLTRIIIAVLSPPAPKLGDPGYLDGPDGDGDAWG